MQTYFKHALFFIALKYYFKQNFFGIELDSSNKIDVPANFSNINKVGMVALIYKAERVGDWSDDEIKEYEMGISKFFEQYFSF